MSRSASAARHDPDRHLGLFRDFLALLPRDTREATALARRHDARMDGRTWLDCDTDQPLRHAFEIRHESFRDPGFIELLREYGAALIRRLGEAPACHTGRMML